MTDFVTQEVRSWMMSNVRGKNTQLELLIRRGLHAAGFRFRIHARILPGKPDIVLPKYRAVVFVHGCFWHGHNCPKFSWPQSNTGFWQRKLQRNFEVDKKNREELFQLGWRQLIIWECAIRGKSRLELSQIIEHIAQWLRSEQLYDEIVGTISQVSEAIQIHPRQREITPQQTH